jgi:hypothetical protein
MVHHLSRAPSQQNGRQAGRETRPNKGGHKFHLCTELIAFPLPPPWAIARTMSLGNKARTGPTLSPACPARSPPGSAGKPATGQASRGRPPPQSREKISLRPLSASSNPQPSSHKNTSAQARTKTKLSWRRRFRQCTVPRLPQLGGSVLPLSGILGVKVERCDQMHRKKGPLQKMGPDRCRPGRRRAAGGRA